MHTDIEHWHMPLGETDMRCTGIYRDEMNPQVPVEQFVCSERARSALGKIFIDLLEEKTWSTEYEVFLADFDVDDKPYLEIKHQTFPSGRPLRIYNDGTTVLLTVRGVGNAVRAHMKGIQEAMQGEIDILETKIKTLDRIFEQIKLDKAMAAIVRVFPEAYDVTPTPGIHVDGDLYSFAKDPSRAPTFVVMEKTDGEFGGVARINHSFEKKWRGLWDGVGKGKHGLFFAALAKEFAARELAIKRHELSCKEVLAEKKSRDGSPFDLYVAKEVILTYKLSPSQWRRVTVEFEDNMPVRIAPLLLEKFGLTVLLT